jgi:hypothetical protein
MRNSQTALLAMWVLISASPVFAKRLPPKPVPPIRIEDVEYSVPHRNQMGFVVATDLKSKVILWQRQIYTVKIDPNLEEDVQWSFITSIKPGLGKILVENESNGIYELDLKTLQVRAIKGSLVIQSNAQ